MSLIDKLLHNISKMEFAREHYTSFAQAMRVHRNAKMRTLRQLEKQTGISNPMLSQYETGHSEPSFKNAALIAAALGFDLNDIWVEK